MYSIPLQAITKVINEDGYINIVIDQMIEINELSNHQRRLFTRIVYGTIENKIYLDYLLKNLIKGKRLKPYLKNTLRMGTYMLKMMNLADHHIVNELVRMIKKQDYKGSQLINAVLRTLINTPMPKLKTLPYLERLHIEYSIPWDLLNLLYTQYPTQIEEILALKGEETNHFRINSLKTTPEAVSQKLSQDGINFFINGYHLSSKVNLVSYELFNDGLITPQDPSSQRVAEVVNPKPNDLVLDGCSAPGGKAFHMASMMNNTGKIIACDIYPHKLRLIEEGSKRLGVNIIKTKLVDIRSYLSDELFDHVLIDAPCSGLGVISHKVDLKYRMTLSKINDLIFLQQEILDYVACLVKEGGYLTYSTCTINIGENENQIQNFLRKHTLFKKIHEEKILPSIENDGFYICKMQRGS